MRILLLISTSLLLIFTSLLLISTSLLSQDDAGISDAKFDTITEEVQYDNILTDFNLPKTGAAGTTDGNLNSANSSSNLSNFIFTDSGKFGIGVPLATLASQYELTVAGKIWLKNSNSSQFIGPAAGQTNTGSHNIGIGSEAVKISTGADNIGIGRNSLISNTTGFQNIGIGWNTLSKQTTALRNTAVGARAMQENVSGDNNTAFGWLSLLNVLGSGNTAVGESVMDRTRDGDQNVAVGKQVMHDNRDGDRNTAVGALAMYALNTVSLTDLVIGQNYQIHSPGNTNWTDLGAPTGTQDEQFIYNGVAATGSGIAVSVNDEGNNNTAIGHSAGRQVGIGSGNVFIGYNTGTDISIRGINNSLWVDNSNTLNPLIYGEFDNDLLRVNGSLEVTGMPVYATTAAAAADALLLSGAMFKVPNGDGTSAVHVKD